MSRLDEILQSWHETPYMAGAGRKGMDGGVDCVHFADEVTAEWHERKLPPLQEYPIDGAVHDAELLARVIAECCRRHDLVQISLTAGHQPGDWMLVRMKGNPFHVGILADDPRIFWHASGLQGKVVWTSVQAMSTNGISPRRLYRSRRAVSA